MLEFSLKNGALFKSTFACFVNEVSDCLLHFDQNGMRVQAMDSSHVSMVMLNFIASEMFNEYKCTEPTSLGVSVKSLMTVLKLSDKKTTVTLIQNEPNNSKLTIGIVSDDKKINFLFDLNLMDIETDELTVPDNLVGWKVVVDFTDITSVTKNMSEFGDSMSLCFGTSTNNELLYQVEGDTGTVTGKIIVQSAEWSDTSTAPNDAVSMKVSMRYLKNYLACRDISDKVELLMGNDIPLCVSYRLSEQSVLGFFIAPKMEE